MKSFAQVRNKQVGGRFVLAWTLSAALWMTGCPKPPTQEPTVASVEASRDGATITAGKTQLPIQRSQRLVAGSVVTTPPGVRASLYLDAGAWVLLDQGSVLKLLDKGIEVVSGRAWIDARVGTDVPVVAAGVSLTAQRAGLAVTMTEGGAKIYCASGQVAWKGEAKSGRLESGLTLLVSAKEAKQTAQALWDDFTLGLAEPGPLRALEPAGVGQLTARPATGLGTARTPLIVRAHDVNVSIDGDMATTTVEQTFFNPRSEYLEGLYTVRLPEAAILEHFSVADGDQVPRRGTVMPMDRQGGGLSSFSANLEWAGAGRYRGLVRNIAPGKVRKVVLRYREWLPHIPYSDAVRRTYVYPMGQSAQMQAGSLSNLGEFSLSVDVAQAQAAALQAGLGAQIEGSMVTLRRSDFKPSADFVLDLIDGKERVSERLVAFRGDELDGQRYLMVQPTPAAGKPSKGLDVVLLVDVSAGTDEARLSLAKSAAQAVLKRLTPADRVAVVAASLSSATLGSEAMGPATKERIDQLDVQLAKQTPGGATNLQQAFLRAVELLPRGQGAVIYIGDGRPTVGALTPNDLKAQLQQLGDLPRFFAAAVGSDANVALLESLCHSGTRSGVVRIEDAPDASRAALYLLERVAQPVRAKHGMASVLNAAMSESAREASYGPMIGATQRMVEAAQKAGAMRPGLDAEDIVHLVGFLWRLPPGKKGEARARRLTLPDIEHARYEVGYGILVEFADQKILVGSDRFMRLWSRAEINRITNLRASQNRRLGTPGPEGSIAKLAMADLNKALTISAAVSGVTGASLLGAGLYLMRRKR